MGGGWGETNKIKLRERESQRKIHFQKENYRMKSSEGDKERQTDK